MRSRQLLLPVFTAVLLLVGLAPTAEAEATTIFVTDGGDSGPGTLRSALSAAAQDGGFTRISLGVDNVTINSTLQYEGTEQLTLQGNWATIAPSPDMTGDLIEVDGSASIKITQLSLTDSPARGLHVSLPATATGTSRVELIDVTIDGGGTPSRPAIHLDDPHSSAAGITLVGSRITVANTKGDGIAVTETGEGDAIVKIGDVVSFANGGHGLAISEAGPGRVATKLLRSIFGAASLYDAEGTKDGVRITEADDGDLYFATGSSTFTANSGTGINLVESGRGHLTNELLNFEAAGNGKYGVVATEDGYGYVASNVLRGSIEKNGRDGIRMTESDGGDLSTTVQETTINNNGRDGVSIDEASNGDLNALIGYNTHVRNNVAIGVRTDAAPAGIHNLIVVGSAIVSGNGTDVTP